MFTFIRNNSLLDNVNSWKGVYIEMYNKISMQVNLVSTVLLLRFLYYFPCEQVAVDKYDLCRKYLFLKFHRVPTAGLRGKHAIREAPTESSNHSSYLEQRSPEQNAKKRKHRDEINLPRMPCTGTLCVPFFSFYLSHRRRKHSCRRLCVVLSRSASFSHHSRLLITRAKTRTS